LFHGFNVCAQLRALISAVSRCKAVIASVVGAYIIKYAWVLFSGLARLVRGQRVAMKFAPMFDALCALIRLWFDGHGALLINVLL
jgi:hypothetical protein